MSLRAFAREIGVNDKAVRNGIASGRLRQSVGRTAAGKPTIIDLEMAKQEWAAHGGARRPAGDVRSEDSAASAGVLVPVTTLVEAQTLATIQRERKLRLDNDLVEGRLVEASKVSKEAFDSARVIRENILNLPARIAGDLAAESDPVAVGILLDRSLREALNTAADALQAGVQ